VGVCVFGDWLNWLHLAQLESGEGAQSHLAQSLGVGLHACGALANHLAVWQGGLPHWLEGPTLGTSFWVPLRAQAGLCCKVRFIAKAEDMIRRADGTC